MSLTPEYCFGCGEWFTDMYPCSCRRKVKA